MKRKISLILVVVTLILGLSMTMFSGCSKKKDDPAISSISMSDYELDIEKGGTAVLNVGYDGESEIVFTTSDESIATLVSEGGKATITGVGVGSAYIDVKVDGQEKTCKVNVFERKYEIVFDREEGAKVVVGTAYQINVKLLVDGKKSNDLVEWSVSGNCTITPNGNIVVAKPTATGQITITATYGDKVSATYTFESVSANS